MYLSIGNKHECNIAYDLENPHLGVSHCLKNMDYRTKINTLLGVKYFITNNVDED